MRDKEAFLYAPTTIDPARRRSPLALSSGATVGL